VSPVQGFRYHPFYCEENAWWLCHERQVSAGDAHVVFIANRLGHCPVAEQRAAAPHQLIWWDYHVVVLDAARRIWDLDTRLGLPLPAADWLVGSFPFIDHLPDALRPTFRLIPCADYRRDFASDRDHMRDPDGRWQHPPPPWPTIGTGMNLARYRHPSADEPGELLDWHALLRRVG
jgi:hypothetical protein